MHPYDFEVYGNLAISGIREHYIDSYSGAYSTRPVKNTFSSIVGLRTCSIGRSILLYLAPW